MKITRIEKSDYGTLIDIWEASVRATHDFLKERDIAALKPLILEQYFDAVDLHGIKTDDNILMGFSGVAEGNIEMLFISPAFRGQGAGSALVRFAIDNQNVTKVDVNEQNPQATGFSKKMDFEVVGRSSKDGQGKPYPLLHMERNSSW
jgi:putative acetyltransferase